MPASIASRRYEPTQAGALEPADMYAVAGAEAQRWAIIALGTVIAIQTLPLGIAPTLLGGQTAALSTTLQVGDRA